jgi:outer membrane protein OmpA-like peptidoglycan-associated protein
VKPEPVKPAKPEPAPKALREEIYFTVNKADVNRKSALDRVVAWMKANSDKNIVIEGHADPTGTPQGNLDLSQRRAEAIRDYIVAAGIASERIEVLPLGDTKLKYGRADARNRRAFIEPKR